LSSLCICRCLWSVSLVVRKLLHFNLYFFKPQDQLEPNLVQCRNVHWMVLTVITEKRPNEAKFSVFIWV
jgi:hypothetical protein